MSSAVRSDLRTPARPGFWDGNLGYAQAFVTVVSTLTVGLAFHAWVGYRWIGMLPIWAIGTSMLLPLLAVAVWARRSPGNRIVKWLTGIPFAVTTCTAVGLLALAGGIVPQSVWAQRFGLESYWGSWPFLMASYLMLTNLVGSCGRRILPLTYTNIVYQTTHLGLAIALIGGAYSGLTLERKRMVLFKGMPAGTMVDEQNREFRAPFEVELREFRMETFNPTLTLATIDKKSPDGLRQSAGALLLKKGVTEKIEGHTITVEKFYKHAAFDGLHWREVPWKTAAPAALLKVTTPDGTTKSDWICSGSPETMPAYMMLRADRAILMNQPRPKKFESELKIGEKTLTVGVNQPSHVAGYDLYQFSYDEKMGAASGYSVIEIVRDRGLPIVYAGIFMMLGGAMLHLGNGIGGKK